jgi:hypothetical protein
MVSLGDQTTWQEQKLEKLRYEYDLKPDDYVIDIGSYRREWADEIIKRYGCKVECFEALDNRAAWHFDGELQMGGAFYYTSQFAEVKPYSYKCFDIGRFLDREVALMKINIEGGEYSLLTYIIDEDFINKIKNIQVQFHLVDGLDSEKMYENLKDKLLKTHSLTWQYPFVWENWKRND